MKNHNKKILFWLLLLILAVPFALSYGTLDYNGQDDYYAGRSVFSTITSDTDNNPKGSLSLGYNMPLLDDLDGDGTREIVVLDGQGITLFQNTTMDILDGVSLPSEEQHSPPYIYDIDADGYKEVIIHQDNSERMLIYEYNGTTFKLQKNFSTASKPTNEGQEGESAVYCSSNDNCILFYIESITGRGGGQPDRIYAQTFSSQQLYSDRVLLYESDTLNNHVICMPRIPKVDYVQMFSDTVLNDKVFTMTFLDVSGDSSNEKAKQAWVYTQKINGTFNISTSGVIGLGGDNLIDGTGLRCDEDKIGDLFNAATITDLDGKPSNGKEIVFAMAYSLPLFSYDDDFRMYSYLSDGSGDSSHYPVLYYGDGVIISNSFIADVYPDTDREADVCTMGYDNQAEDERYVLLCVSPQSAAPYTSYEFVYKPPTWYNITSHYSQYNSLSQSIQGLIGSQYRTAKFGGIKDLDEIVTPYGMFAVDWEDCGDAPVDDACRLTLLWRNPVGDSVVVPLDPQKTGYNDMIVMNNRSIYYFDDGYENQGAYIDDYEICPTNNEVWEINTTVIINVNVNDVDGDPVDARVILYYTDDNEMVQNWTLLNATPPHNFNNFLFTANKTIGGGRIVMEARDTNDTTKVDRVVETFTVASDGVIYGEVGCNAVNLENPYVASCVGPECETVPEMTLNDIPSLFLPEEAVPTAFYPLVSLLIILLVSGGALFIAAKHDITQGGPLALIGAGAGFLTWIALILVGMVPGWTLLVALFIAAAGTAIYLFTRGG